MNHQNINLFIVRAKHALFIMYRLNKLFYSFSGLNKSKNKLFKSSFCNRKKDCSSRPGLRALPRLFVPHKGFLMSI